MKLLDLYSCAGGAARGYQHAGFHVTGIDIAPRPTYCGDGFVQADALDYAAAHGHRYDAIHASPPCQNYSAPTRGTNAARNTTTGREHPDLVEATRAVLQAVGRPYVIENVAGSPVRKDLRLCGEMFGLGVLQHRWFELGGWSTAQPAHRPHRGRVRGWRHGVFYDGPYVAAYGAGGGKATVAEMQQAKQITWTADRVELCEAIPPAYTSFLGARLVAFLRGQVAV
ncbi:hypothetical protein SAMN05421803_11759 [Nocardiopsis flavescens]|uniref:DNA (Cytosine-5)-methyltransferase 1 n=1 Tax=Nocardiopsis flavescens TaxID=758803 RepID=A0A1M6RD78_9ACTN|nr:DNA cytosine methyltransferase [Nocardiopsis flavescens]SHK30445.1 hypothetical protein SAMN05421803_11759 [Nocardiopsis flavescens]